MIEVHAEFPQREVIQVNAVVDNEEKTVSEVIISAKPEITGVTASVDNETGTPYVDVTETGTGTDFSFNLAFHNLKGDKGEKGETGETGQDGFSPSVTVEQTETGATITATDKDGTTSANLYNGADGQDGADGQAATVTVGSTTTGQAGTSASVVNSGTSSAAILDFTIPKGDKGDTGATGANGQDGFSPTATVTKSGDVATITITDKNGTTQTQILDGTGSITDVKVNNTSVVTNGVANIVTNTAYNKSSNKIATMSDLPADEIFITDYGTTDYTSIERAVTAGKIVFCKYTNNSEDYYLQLIHVQTAIYDFATVEDGVAYNAELQVTNVATWSITTTNIGTVKSVNNTQPDANGNVTISVSSGVFIAEYGTTIFPTIMSNLSKFIYCKYVVSSNEIYYLPLTYYNVSSVPAAAIFSIIKNNIEYKATLLANGDVWSFTTTNLQTELVSGTNIKTINSASLLGSGNISVQTPISDLATIRSGASAGATAVQPEPIDALYAWQYSFSSPPSNIYTKIIPTSTTAIECFDSDGNSIGTGQFVNSDGAKWIVYGQDSYLYSRWSEEDIINLAALTDKNSNVLNIVQADGQWVWKMETVSSVTALGSYDLTSVMTSYLPDDDYSYEVLFRLGINRNDNSGTNTQYYLFDPDLITSGQSVGKSWVGVQADGANWQQGNTAGMVILKPNRKLTLNLAGYKLASSECIALAYRRIGTNA